MYLLDVFKGKAGLGRTYWLWFLLGGVVVAAGGYVIKAVVPVTPYYTGLNYVLDYGYGAFAIAWTFFTALAVINASSYDRKRGFWGWTACVLAALGILKGVYSSLVLAGIAPQGWSDFERSVLAENYRLPMAIADDLTLSQITTRYADRSLTYHMKFDRPTVNETTFDTKAGKTAVLGNCAEMRDVLKTADVVIMKYTANDGTSISISIRPADCGF